MNAKACCGRAVLALAAALSLTLPSHALASGTVRNDTHTVRAVVSGGGGRSLVSGGRSSYFTVGSPVAGRTIRAPKFVTDGLTAFLLGQHDTEPPSALTLLNPATNSDTNETTITFRWSLATDSSPPISYRLIVDTDFAGSYVIDSTLQDSAARTVTLPATETYYWRVIATDIRGNARTIGDSRVFVYVTTRPTLLSPIGGAETTYTAVKFRWSASTSSGHPIKDYRLQVARGSAVFDTPVVEAWHNASTTDTTPNYLFNVNDTFYWRMLARDSIGNQTTWTLADSFIRRNSTSDTTAPVSVSNLILASLDTGAILAAWDRSPSADVLQYNLFWDSGAGISADTLLAVLSSTGAASYTYLTRVLQNGQEYRFRVTAQDTGGNQEPGVVGSAYARTSAQRVANAVIVSPAGGERFVSGDSAIPIVSRLEGTAPQLDSALTLTGQYRTAAGGTWSNMTAASGITGNANPIALAAAKDDFGTYRFHWNSSGLAVDTYELRVLVTDKSGETSYLTAGSLSVRFVNPSAESPTFVTTKTSDGGFQVRKVISANRSETLTVTNLPDTQSAQVFIPTSAFPKATDTANVYADVKISFSNSFDSALPSRNLAAVLDAIEVRISNGDTLLANGQEAIVTISFRDDDQDGFVDGTRVRWNTLKIYRHSGVPGEAWVELTIFAKRDPTAAVPGYIQVKTSRFSIFRLVGVAAASNMAELMVAPNPYRPALGNQATGLPYTGAAGTGIYFLNVPAQVRIELFTVTGRRVFKFESQASTGQVQWNVKNDDGREVASGVYIWTATDLASGERKSGKLVIIR